MTLVACSLLAQTTFTSGKLRYEVIDEDNLLAQVVNKNPDNDADAYQNITMSDIKTSVDYGGKTYTVVGIGVGAFYKGSLGTGSNRLPEGLIYIDNGAFDGCTGGSCIIPSTMTMLAPMAFAGNLFQIVSASNDNPVYGKLTSTQHGTYSVTCLTNKEGNKLIAVPGAKPLSYGESSTTYMSVFNIPDQITEIGEYAFYKSPHLVRVGIPATVTKIGDAAFYNCEKLASVTLPNPNVELGESVWSSCYALSSVSLPQGMEKLARNTFSYCNLSSITLPEGMKSIGMMAFTSNVLTSINLPSTLELIDSCAFQNNENLTSVNIKNVKRIDHFAFMGCSSLRTVTGNNKLEYIESSALCRTGMIDAQLPEGLKYMEGNVFFRTTSLQTITIPSTVEWIEYNPIVGCTSVKRVQVAAGSEHFAELDSCLYEIADQQPIRLVSVPANRTNKVVVVPPGVETLGRQCAREVALTEVYMPKSVKELEASAFSGVTTLTTVSCMAMTPPTVGSDNCFTAEAYANATLYVPMRSVESYMAADIWKNFQNIVGVDTGVDFIPGDVNDDNRVDVMDVTAVINHILGNTPEVFIIEAADLNSDDVINVMDVTAIINIILSINDK